MEWKWSEQYSSQRARGLCQSCADRFDLKRDIQFETRVTAAHWDEATHRWGDRTAAATMSPRLCVMAPAALSIPKDIDPARIARFQGEVYAPASWPKDGVDFTGKTGRRGRHPAHPASPVGSGNRRAGRASDRVPGTAPSPCRRINGPTDPKRAQDWFDHRDELTASSASPPSPAMSRAAPRRARFDVDEGNASGAMRALADRRPRHRRHVQGSDDRQAVERHALRIRSRQDQDQGQGPRGGRKSCCPTAIRSSPSGPLRRQRLFRGVQLPRQTSPSSTSRGMPIETVTATGIAPAARITTSTSSSSRSASTRWTGRARRNRHPRPRRPDAQEDGPTDRALPRSRHHRLSHLFHDHRPGQPLGARQHDGRLRAYAGWIAECIHT